MRFKSAVILFGLAAMLFVASAQAAPDRLVIDFMFSSGTQRSGWVNVLAEFNKLHPDVEIIHNEFSPEAYKRDFEKRLRTENVDLAFWFAGDRLRQAIGRGLIAPLDETFARSDMKSNFVRSTFDAVRVDGQSFALPLHYYPWGFFYRRSVFTSLGLTPPSNWVKFLEVCEALKAADIAPIAVGGKSGWPLAAWFDYLDLRINGLDFHQKLLGGEIAFNDQRVHKVFDQWRVLLVNNYFMADTMNKEWDAVLPYFYRAKVGMVLLGGFAAMQFPDIVRDDIGFFPFPSLADNIASYEEAPLDVLVQSARSQNRQAAQRFLSFLAKSSALDTFGNATRTISPRIKAELNDPFLKEGKKLLDRAAGISFFFDRDAVDYLVKPAFEGFKVFVTPPYDTEAAIATIHRAAKCKSVQCNSIP